MPAIINPLDGTKKSRALITAGWDDVPHLDPDAKRELLEETQAWIAGFLVVTGVASAGTIDLESLAHFYSDVGENFIFKGGQEAMLIYPAKYNLTDDAIMNTWFDIDTRHAKDIGDGTASGAFVAPTFFLGGMAGNMILGDNRGTAPDLLYQVPISGRDTGFRDIN